MEQQKEDGQTDYWLVQYQRLMDQKPQSLIDRVCIISSFNVYIIALDDGVLIVFMDKLFCVLHI